MAILIALLLSLGIISSPEDATPEVIATYEVITLDLDEF